MTMNSTFAEVESRPEVTRGDGMGEMRRRGERGVLVCEIFKKDQFKRKEKQ